MNIDVLPYELALRSPFATAHSIIDDRRGALVSTVLEGATGWGDLCPMPGWSQHSLDRLVDDLVRASSADTKPAEVADALFRTPEARAAVVGAMYDALAQSRGVTVCSLLASEFSLGEPSARLAVNATIGAADVSTALTSINLAIANGFRTLKLKVGHRPLEADLSLVESARRSVGADVEIRLDANGAWRPEAALDALDRFARYDIALCEEPTDGIEAIGAVGADSPIPVAVDESARTRRDLDAAVATVGVAAVVVKPQALGGPELAVRAIVSAQRNGVMPIVTSMIDSAVGVAHAAHVAAACGVPAAHGLATSALLATDVARPLAVENGYLVMPTEPGLGVRPSRPPR